MGIGAIGGFYQNRPAVQIKQVDVATIKAQDEQKRQAEVQLPKAEERVPQTNDARRNAISLEDISLDFNTGDTYDYIGKERDITLLDMGQALSDVKKDQILDQYRYFVGDASNIGRINHSSEDGIVIVK